MDQIAVLATTRAITEILTERLTDQERSAVVDALVAMIPQYDGGDIEEVAPSRHSVTAADDVPRDIEEPAAAMRPSTAATVAARKAAAADITRIVCSCIAALDGHPEGMTRAELALAAGADAGDFRFQHALRGTVNAGRIRATGSTNNRRYFPATKTGV